MMRTIRHTCLSLLAWALLIASLYFILQCMIQTQGHSLAWGHAESLEQPGTVRVLPSPALVNVGQIVTVEVWLENAANYYGIDIRLSFDPHYLSVPAGRVVPLWDVIDGSNHWIIKNEVDNAHGTVWYAVTGLNPAEPFTGTGRLCAIGFSGVAVGTSELHFTYAKGSTRDGTALYPALVDGAIVVQQLPHFQVHLPLVARSFRRER